MAHSIKSTTRMVLLTFVGTLGVYLFLAAGYIDTIDADASVELAKSLVEKGSVRLSPAHPDPVLYARVGSGPAPFVSKLGLGTALVYIPSVLAAKGITRITSLPISLVLPFLVSLTNCFVTALLVAFLAIYFLDRRLAEKEACLLALVAGFATLLFPYSKTCQREPLQALCLVGLVVFSSRKKFLSAAFWMGFGLSVKSLWLVPAFPFFILACRWAKNERQLLKFLLPFILVGAALPFYQWWCFGNAWETGYNLANVGLFGAKWSTPFWEGFGSQVTSWRSSVFVFSPVLLFCLVPLWKRARAGRLDAFDGAILASFLLQTCLYACWFNPLGGWSLGPRYLVTVLPTLFFLFRQPTDLALVYNYPRAAKVLVSFCVLFQFVHTSVKAQQYWELVYLSGQRYHSAQWVDNAVFFSHKLLQKEEKYRVQLQDGSIEEYDLSGVRSLQGFNFWWLHFLRYQAII